MQARFIAVSGNIGAGKTTLVKFLSKRFGLEPLYEPVGDNPYLKDFYGDMKRYAFHSQMFYLSRKLALHLKAQRSQSRIVIDRTVYEDADIFARALHTRRVLSKRDFQTYYSFYELIRTELQPPDLVIYLKSSIRGLKRRIRQRGRSEELDMPGSYLKRLNTYYDDWYEGYDLGEKAIIETDKLDYLHDLIDRVDLIEQIEALLE